MSPNHGEYETQPCPLCGATVKILPSHLLTCDETEGEPDDD